MMILILMLSLYWYIIYFTINVLPYLLIYIVYFDISHRTHIPALSILFSSCTLLLLLLIQLLLLRLLFVIVLMILKSRTSSFMPPFRLISIYLIFSPIWLEEIRRIKIVKFSSLVTIISASFKVLVSFPLLVF